MSLLLDALKEAEKSRKGHNNEATTEPEGPSVEELILDLDLPEETKQDRPSTTSGADSSHADTPATTATPTNSASPLSTNNARIAAHVFENQKHPSRQLKSGLLVVLLTVIFIGFVAMYFLLRNQEESIFIQSSIPAARESATVMEPRLSPVDSSVAVPTPPATGVMPTESPSTVKAVNHQTESADLTNTVQAPLDMEASLTGSYPQQQHTTPIEQPATESIARGATNTHIAQYSGVPTATAQPQDSTNVGIQISKRKPSTRTNNLLSAANSAFKQGDLVATEQAYRQLLEQSPTNIEAASSLASLLMQRGANQEARALYFDILDRDPGNLPAKVALINLSAADPANLAAGSQLKQLIIEYPELAYLHASLGNFHARRQNWPAAQAAYFEAFRLDDKNTDYAFNLAVSLDQISKPDLAATFYEKAIELAGNQPSQFDVSDAIRRLTEIRGATP